MFILDSTTKYFMCENKHPISLAKRCDGAYDCPFAGPKKNRNATDYSDEKNCTISKSATLCRERLDLLCGEIYHTYLSTFNISDLHLLIIVDL